jgi:glycosyltransferase involved in cell wall biosynthesis
MSPTASIVIRCYNERDHIGKLLYGIFQQNRDDFEVILVDSGSTDGTLEVAQKYPIEDIVYIDPEEFSFGRALNMGCESASGEYCVFASAHTYPKRRDWLSKMLEKFNDNVAIVYGKQRGNEITKYPEKQIFRQWFPEESKNIQRNAFVNNANAAVRREIWKEFPYDEQLTGLEGLDWAKRVQDAGYEIAYAADATIIHVHDESRHEIYNRYRREAIALNRIFPDRDFSFSDFIRASLTNIIADYAAAIRDREFLESVLEIPVFRLMQFWGTYRGFSRNVRDSEQIFNKLYYPDVEGYPSNSEKNSSSDDKKSNRGLRIEYTESASSLPAFSGVDEK